jgi:hypothetical protein
MPFALTNNPSQSEISDAINYLLANFGPNLAADPDNGQISGPSGVIIAYLYQYIAVKYADSFDGTLNFSNSPTGRLYYGLRNTNSSVESTNPADYIWFLAAGGFGSTKFLFYQTNGGRQINFFVGTTAPNSTYLQESGSSIDLDIVTTTTAYNTAAPSIYIWTSSSTPPTRPSTTSTYTWSTGAYTAPSGWTTAPITNTTPGYYLWAITIPLIVNANTVTSTLDWTNTSYPIYAFSSNGSTGSAGGNGISALTAYLAQSQSTAAPSTPSNTSGPTAPSGWSLTAPSVSVGQVLWYSFGRYNSSAATLDGVPSGQTSWGTPTAASIFQDIRSDNWNGTTPPTYGTPSSYGTTGYYISRSTGNCYFNNGIFRGSITGASGTFSGDITTNGDAVFQGQNAASQSVVINGTSYNIDYSSAAYATSSSSGKVRVGQFGYGNSLSSTINVGVMGIGLNNSLNYGVVGQSNGGSGAGGFFSSASSTGSGLLVTNTGSGTALQVGGPMVMTNTTMVTNLNSEYSNKLLGSAGTNTLRFVQGTFTGSSVATFNATNKPASASTNSWMQITIDSTTLYIPVWT